MTFQFGSMWMGKLAAEAHVIEYVILVRSEPPVPIVEEGTVVGSAGDSATFLASSKRSSALAAATGETIGKETEARHLALQARAAHRAGEDRPILPLAEDVVDDVVAVVRRQAGQQALELRLADSIDRRLIERRVPARL